MSKFLNVMIFRDEIKLNVRSTFPFIIFIRSNTQRPRGVAPGTFLLPLGHSYARWRLDRFFLYVRERKLLISGHIPHRRMQSLELISERT